MKNFTDKLKIVFQQRRPIKFLLSRALRDLGLLDCLKITFSYKTIKLRLTRSALSLTLWIDRDERKEDWEVVRGLLSNGDIYVDVGAHIGHLAIAAAGVIGNSGLVYAFEAHPRTFDDLLKNIEINGARNIIATNIAVTDKAGLVRFSDYRNANDQNKIDADGHISVLGLPLDLVLTDVKNIDLLKIDVEGFEKFVLQGAESILQKTKVIYFEAWTHHFASFGYSFDDLYHYLDTKGFEVGILSARKIKRVSRDFVPHNCINMLAWNRKIFGDDTPSLAL